MPSAAEKVAAIVAAYRETSREFDIPGTNLSVSLQKAPQLVDGRLVLWLDVSRGGAAVPVSNPFVFVNPPLRRGDDTVDRPLLAMVQMVIDAIQSVVK